LRQLRGALRQVTTVHLNDPDLVEDLIDLRRNADCVVDRVGPRSLRIRSGVACSGRFVGA
jgi:hypothetical protein